MASYFEPSINQIRGSSNSRVIAACDDYYAIVSGKSAEIINTCTNNSFKFDIPLDSRINSAYLCLYNNLHLITTSESQVMLSTIDSSSTEIISHHCIALDLGFIECISCDETVNFVSVSVANIIYVFDLIQKTTTLLKGHLKSITALKFIDNRNQETCLISSSEDRTYKLWNVQTRRFLFQSEVVSSFAFTALAIDPRSDRNRFCISSEDGQVRFYSFQTSRSNLDFEPRLLTIFKTDKIKNQSEMKEE